ncbi:hypothetical protein BH10CHL1_BH10CHL1_38090 [soil metagenome]
MTLQHEKYLNVQYGCGLSAPANWLNFDASPTLLIQRIPVIGSILTRNGPLFPSTVQFGDIVRGLPIKEQSCSAIYCSHILEHLSLADCRIALKNTYNYLKPGGLFRFVLPDLEQLANTYLQSTADDAAIQFVGMSGFGMSDRSKGISGLLRVWLGNSHHRWMWDYKSITKVLAEVGFVQIRRAQLGDSKLEIFENIEEPSRWQGCLGLECFRP